MKGESEFTKPGVGKLAFIPFDSRLAPLTNAILRKRYGELASVKEVLAWLAAQNAGCSRESYQKFLRRLLLDLGDAQALATGIDLPMLHAVRRRLRLPINGCKTWPRHYHRGRRSES